MEQKNILTSNGGQKVLNESQVDSILVIFTYTAKEFLYWWYVSMTLWHLRMLSRIALLLDDNLSISLLLKNFILPWHRDFSFIGYIFGILIKIIYLPIAILAFVLMCAGYIFIILLWLILPPATVFFTLRSIFSI
jgi:hypothetical protein